MAGNAEGNCIQWGQYDVAESFKTEGSRGRQNWIQLHRIIYMTLNKLFNLSRH